MRILVVTNDYPPRPGGIQQWIGNVVDALDADVRVLAPADGPATNDRGESIVVRGRRRWMLPTRRTRTWITRHVEDFAADVVLYVAPHPLTFVARTVRATTGVPYAVMTHGAEVTIPAAIPGIRQLLAGPLRDADVVFAVSDFTAGRVAKLTGREVTTVGAGVDVDRFTPGDTDGEERPDGAVVVGCVSRFVPRKGQARLLDAAAAVIEAGQPVRVVLVGKGRQEKTLRRQAAALGLEVDFHVDVPWSELPERYREFDVFAMPCKSRWLGLEVEGLGIVFLEASASGVPVIAGDSGGAPETVVEGETGLVVRTRKELVDALSRLVRSPEDRAGMGAAGRAFVESRWTWEQVAERLLDGLRRVIATT